MNSLQRTNKTAPQNEEIIIGGKSVRIDENCARVKENSLLLVRDVETTTMNYLSRV